MNTIYSFAPKASGFFISSSSIFSICRLLCRRKDSLNRFKKFSHKLSMFPFLWLYISFLFSSQLIVTFLRSFNVACLNRCGVLSKYASWTVPPQVPCLWLYGVWYVTNTHHLQKHFNRFINTQKKKGSLLLRFLVSFLTSFRFVSGRPLSDDWLTICLTSVFWRLRKFAFISRKTLPKVNDF